MNMNMRIMLATMILFHGVSWTRPEGGTTDKEPDIEHQEKNILEYFFDHENKHIGAKIGYAGVMCKACSEYAQAFYHRDAKRTDASWQKFKQYYHKIAQVPTPYVEQIGYGGLYAGFGYWLYNRMAYPLDKKNWGRVKKTAAKIIIPVWVLKGLFFSDVDVHKKSEFEAKRQEILQLQRTKNTLEAENTALQKAIELNLKNFAYVEKQVEKAEQDHVVVRGHKETQTKIQEFIEEKKNDQILEQKPVEEIAAGIEDQQLMPQDVQAPLDGQVIENAVIHNAEADKCQDNVASEKKNINWLGWLK